LRLSLYCLDLQIRHPYSFSHFFYKWEFFLIIIASQPQWQIDLWNDVQERMGKPYRSWQDAWKRAFNPRLNEQAQQKNYIDTTKKWIELNARFSILKPTVSEIEYNTCKKTFCKAMEVIAQIAIDKEYARKRLETGKLAQNQASLLDHWFHHPAVFLKIN
jgi:hypothetical protein